jgi:2-polyprenyl-3-methyl-5-hydroxy-6-metoxy-1,4-benzoquinol methylase
METFDISVKRFDEFASEYADRFKNIDSYRQHFDAFCDQIDNSKPKILELACGPGNVTGYLKQRFPYAKITAVDLAPRMIEIARQNISDVDFRIMDVRDLNSLDLEFDSIMCSFCLPFLSRIDANKLISDCSKKIIKNGLLYLSTMEGDESKAGFESTSFSGDAKVYFNYHMQQDLMDALMRSGFSIVYNIRQDYHEENGSVTTDLMMIAKKN